MAIRTDTPAIRQWHFHGTTVEELRDELNEFARFVAHDLQTEKLKVQYVDLIPVRGPLYQSDAPFGRMFLRQYNYQLASPTAMVNVVLPHVSLTKVLNYLESGTQTVDADGTTVAGGLHDR